MLSPQGQQVADSSVAQKQAQPDQHAKDNWPEERIANADMGPLPLRMCDQVHSNAPRSSAPSRPPPSV